MAAVYERPRVRWFLIPFVLGSAIFGAAFYLAGLDDGFHQFTDARGDYQVVVSCPDGGRFRTSLAIAAVAIVALWLLGAALLAWRKGFGYQEALYLDAWSLLPLGVLLVTALRNVPALAALSPAAFLFSTKLSQVLFWAVLALVVTLKIRSLSAASDEVPNAAEIGRFSDRAVGWFVFLIVAAGLLVYLPAFTGKWPFGGDEPHYLVVAHSLVEDGDIYIEDDHEQKVYRRFSEWREIPPQYSRLTVDGRIIPFHRIGLPLMAAFPYALAGKSGALVLMVLFAALAAANTYWLTAKVVADRRAALTATAWAVASVPFLCLSLLFYTEIPLALFTLLALNLMVRKGGEPPRWPWIIPLLIWWLPWIHARGFVTACVLTALLIVLLKRDIIMAAAMAAFSSVLALGTPVFNLLMYGEFGLVAEMGAGQHGDLGILNVFRNLGGLLLDQEFGLLLYNVATLAAVLGLVSLWRINRGAFVWTLAIAGLTLGSGLAYHMWWGGDSVPARYVASVIPLAALPMAALLADKKKKLSAAFAKGGIAVSIAVAVALVANPALLADSRDQVSSKLSALSLGPFDVVEWWPSWFAGQGEFWLRTGILLISALAIASVLLASSRFIIERGGRSVASISMARSGALLLLMALLVPYDWMISGIVEGEPNGRRPYDPASDLVYLQRFRHQRCQFVDQTGALRPDSLPGTGFSAERLFSSWNLRADPKAEEGRSMLLGGGEASLMLTPSTPLWAGEYRLRLALRAEAGEGPISAGVWDLSTAGRDPVRSLAQADEVLNASFSEILMPVRIEQNSLGLRVDLKFSGAVRFRYACLDALGLMKVSEWDLPGELFDKPALSFNEYLLFVEPRALFPPDGKWFWTRSDTDAAFSLAARREFSGLQFQLVGYPGVTAYVEVGGAERSAAFTEPDQAVDLEFEARPVSVGEQWLIYLRIKVEGAFVPARLIPGSSDERSLGVHTRIVLRRR